MFPLLSLNIKLHHRSYTDLSLDVSFLETIKTFPISWNITDVRYWFGCITQISYGFSTSPHMAPFHHLFSSKDQFSGQISWRKDSRNKKNKNNMAMCPRSSKLWLQPTYSTSHRLEWTWYSTLAVSKEMQMSSVQVLLCQVGRLFWLAVDSVKPQSLGTALLKEKLICYMGCRIYKFYLFGMKNKSMYLDNK